MKSSNTPLHKWQLNYSPELLNNQFAEFLTLKQTTLNKDDITTSAIILESFLVKHFNICHNLPNCDEKVIEIKKNFIQKTVFQKYKTTQVPSDWENEYNFVNQGEFIEEASHETNWDKLEKYTAFAMFTNVGIEKHRNDTIFHLPKSANQKDDFLEVQGSCVKSESTCVKSKRITERNDFNLTDTPPQSEAIDWNLGYCLYCHNRGKDSCSKGLNVGVDGEKLGCPLRQDISESILLKRQNFHIAALAVIMKENPLCILTGRRICQNCEEACIFQKQEAVDIQSVETQILLDVLSMPFGIEIYNLLLQWNPLCEMLYSTENHNLEGKAVVVAGLGPAGLFATHLFSKFGAKVLGIDALNIEIPAKIQQISQNIIQHSTEILNEPLSTRTPSNIGGVMEYGITSRWNKNFLDVLIALLLRRTNVEFQGSTRIGFLLNYEDIFNRFQFNHLALCIGSATPQVPKIKGIFSGYSLTKGVVMASDFLMSLHINRKSNHLETIVNSPVYILGCGLTAIDVACEVRELLKTFGKVVDVKILYYQDFTKSSSYKINHFEFQKALEQGVEIMQNVEIVEIKRHGNGISYVVLNSGEVLDCKLLIIAIGTKPNLSHASDFIGKDGVSFFGDCNPQYTGSVVNALASVKNEIGNSVAQMKKNQNIVQNYGEIFERNISIIELENNFFEIKLHAPFFAQKASVGKAGVGKIKAGNVLKLQEFGRESVAITIAKIEGEVLTLYLENSNTKTDGIVKAILSQRKIHINGINCTAFPEIPQNCTVVACEKARLVFGEIFKNHTIITPQQFIERSTVLVHYNKNKKEKKIKKKKNENYFIAIHPSELDVSQDISQYTNSVIDGSSFDGNNFEGNIFLYQKMNCMLGGICGRCIKPDGTYACVDNIVIK